MGQTNGNHSAGGLVPHFSPKRVLSVNRTGPNSFPLRTLMAIILWRPLGIGYQNYQRICVFVVLSMLLVRKRGLYQGTGYSRYFSNGFYHGGLQFSSVSFFAENFKIGRFYLVLFPFLFMLIL